VSRTDIPGARIYRKPLPTSIKTIGDLIQIRRYEKRLTLWQLAQKMGIAAATVKAWERNTAQPNGQQMKQLAGVLKFRC
jgi:DNA-binding transcriptional regulator YiaG